MAAAICIGDRDRRIAALDEIIDRLAQEPANPEWPQVYKYLEVYRDLPATTLDLTNRLAANLQAMATALLQANEVRFEVVCSLAEQLPFAWFLVPLRTWQTTGQLWVGALREQLHFLEDAEVLIWESFSNFSSQTRLRLGYLKPVAEWLQVKLFPTRFQFAINDEQLNRSYNNAYQCLLRAHTKEEWPPGYILADWWLARAHKLPSPIRDLWRQNRADRERSAILSAPLTAAVICTFASSYEPELVHELKLLRAFDMEWFDTAYGVFLALFCERYYQPA